MFTKKSSGQNTVPATFLRTNLIVFFALRVAWKETDKDVTSNCLVFDLFDVVRE